MMPTVGDEMGVKVLQDDLNVADGVVRVKGGGQQDRGLFCEEMYPTVEQKTELQGTAM